MQVTEVQYLLDLDLDLEADRDRAEPERDPDLERDLDLERERDLDLEGDFEGDRDLEGDLDDFLLAASESSDSAIAFFLACSSLLALEVSMSLSSSSEV